MRRFEFTDGSSSKFWEIEQAGTDLNIRWGRLGTAGQSQTKNFADAARAKAAMDKLVLEKTGKGYAEVERTVASVLRSIAARAKAAMDKLMHEKTGKGHEVGVEAGKTPAPKAEKPTVKKDVISESKASTPTTTAPVAESAHESLDSQVERTVAAVLRSIVANEVKGGDNMTEARLKKQYRISDRGAKLVQDELRALGILGEFDTVYWGVAEHARKCRVRELSADSNGTLEAVSAVTALAKEASTSSISLARAAQASERWPEAAIVALSHLIVGEGRAGILVPILLRLLRGHSEKIDALRPHLAPAAQAVIDRLLQRLTGPTDPAGMNELPTVLAAPPWRSAKKKKEAVVIAVAPLALPPVENWPEGAKRKALELDRYDRVEYASAQVSVETLASRFFSNNKKEAAMAAIRQAQSGEQGMQAAKTFITVWRSTVGEIEYLDGIEISLLPLAIAAPLWNTVLAGKVSKIYGFDHLIAKLGTAALPGLVAEMQRNLAQTLPIALHFGAVELAEIMAHTLVKMKSLREDGRDWLLKYPEHAACGLIAPALGKAGDARNCAISALRLLAIEGHGALLTEVASRYGNPDVVTALEAVLNEDPLDRYPAKHQKLPEFWQPKDWSRPVLNNGKLLPDEALDALGEMLTFPTHEGIYAGIEQVKATCTSASLAEFVWECFNAWLEADAPNKENWALTALGLLGNDDTARKLTSLIRAWPGEAAHARAVMGLSVLENIGSDVALMLLNGIAQKVKFKGLQDNAREKISGIAEKRGLTPEELEDRLAPDLGLDEKGTLILDFGPRQFKVGFDEALKPYVREMDGDRPGVRLADLPKPKKTDDAELANASVDRFKALKKDARTIASQQVTRLEVAMCLRRRWMPEVFSTFLANHPLVRYLVQRLIWGVFAVEGGKLLSCFRVAEDGSYATAEDEPFELPTGENIRIGLPHALEIPASEAAAFGQVFADYELLQPFTQIGRDTYAFTDAEKASLKLERWKGVEVPTGRVLGLVNKGWRRGVAQDAGGIEYFSKPLGNDKAIILYLDPGIIVGMVDEYPEQELCVVKYGHLDPWGELDDARKFAELDDIVASELIREMEALRA